MTAPNLHEATIFNVARQIEAPEARRLYICQACGEDRNLQARIEDLLRVHDQERTFLDSPTDEFRAILGVPVNDGPGTLIGPYKLRERIGEGGMGTVFLADQSQPIQRQVALKLIRAGLDSSRPVRRRAAGTGADGPPEYCQSARRRHNPRRARWRQFG